MAVVAALAACGGDDGPPLDEWGDTGDYIEECQASFSGIDMSEDACRCILLVARDVYATPRDFLERGSTPEDIAASDRITTACADPIAAG